MGQELLWDLRPQLPIGTYSLLIPSTFELPNFLCAFVCVFFGGCKPVRNNINLLIISFEANRKKSRSSIRPTTCVAISFVLTRKRKILFVISSRISIETQDATDWLAPSQHRRNNIIPVPRELQ